MVTTYFPKEYNPEHCKNVTAGLTAGIGNNTKAIVKQGERIDDMEAKGNQFLADTAKKLFADHQEAQATGRAKFKTELKQEIKTEVVNAVNGGVKQNTVPWKWIVTTVIGLIVVIVAGMWALFTHTTDRAKTAHHRELQHIKETHQKDIQTTKVLQAATTEIQYLRKFLQQGRSR